MTEFKPTSEAVEAVQRVMSLGPSEATACIEAFVEAEGLKWESDLPDTYEDRIRDWRLVGPLREIAALPKNSPNPDVRFAQAKAESALAALAGEDDD